MFNEAILHNWDVELKLRSNIIKMHFLIHNTLSAPVFNDLIRYSWFRARYILERVQFSDVMDVWFYDNLNICDVINCGKNGFVQCSHWAQFLCFQHFFLESHFHF